MKRIFSHKAWTILAKGFIVILLGLLIIAWPIVIISLLVISLGSYIFIDGIFSLVRALKKRKTEETNWDWMFLNGMFGIFAGILTFFNPFVIVAVATFLLLSK
jgi:uncharacterized membrane protein HdeD (DUF308 family)